MNMSSSQVGYIYTLNHPITDEIRYVGLTTRSLKFRLCRHISEARKSGKTHKNNWILNILSRNLKPKIKLLEIVPIKNICEREIYWIARFRKEGKRLINNTDGGEGTFGYKHTEEVCKAASERTKKQMSDPEARKKISLLKQGSKHHSAKLTETDIQEIDELLSLGKLSQVEIGQKFNVGSSTISAIYNKRQWMHVDTEEHDEIYSYHPRGSKHGYSKLDEDQVKDIKQLLSQGKSQREREVAKLFDVTQPLIGMIGRNEIWQHVSGPEYSAQYVFGSTGESNHQTKLTADDVLEIRESLNEGESGRSLALKFGLDKKSIYNIRDRKTWKHV